MSFPPCSQTKEEFTIKYLLYGPACLFATACSFIYVTLDGWDEAGFFERKSAIVVMGLMGLIGWILLPISIILEVIKMCFYPAGLITYILTQKYYQSYPHDTNSTRYSSKTHVLSTIKSESDSEEKHKL